MKKAIKRIVKASKPMAKSMIKKAPKATKTVKSRKPSDPVSVLRRVLKVKKDQQLAPGALLKAAQDRNTTAKAKKEATQEIKEKVVGALGLM